MIWLIKFVIFGHVHQWKEVERVTRRVDDLDTEEYTTGQRVYTVCETCGAHRKWDLI